MKQNLYYPFEIIYKTADHYNELGQGQNFFELVYILDGAGSQRINKNTFPYKAGHLLLVTPSDLNTFEVERTTKFLFVCFNDFYLKTDMAGNTKGERAIWIKKLEFILQNATNLPGCILKSGADKLLVKSIVNSIVREQNKTDLYSRELVQQLMNSLIILVARSLAQVLPEKLSTGTDDKVESIFQYVQQHIHEPERLKTSVMSERFNVSPNYLGKFFKEQAGETLQQFIIKCKMKIIETKLLHSNSRISEIVQEMQFTDAGHLNKFFKKQKGISLSAFRKKALAGGLSCVSAKVTG